MRVPLATMNRHGLVAGATGTGKTKTLQVLAEQLSRAGVPVLVADVKGDVSGLAAPAEPGGAGEKRMTDLGLPFAPEAFPVEFLALGGLGPGVPLRSTVSDFGPQLLAKVLGANETQESSLALVFHYADSKGLPLLDLEDLRALLEVPRLRRGQARARRHRRPVAGDGRRAAALAARAADGRRDGVLRRAAVRRGRPAAAGAGRPRRRLLRRAGRGAGQAGAVVDRADVARRRAVRGAARGRRPAEAEARGLPRRGAPAVRRRDRRVPGLARAHRAADPLQGRRRLLRHPAADRSLRRGALPAGPARAARAARLHPGGREEAARDRLDLPALGLLRRRGRC